MAHDLIAQIPAGEVPLAKILPLSADGDPQEIYPFLIDQLFDHRCARVPVDLGEDVLIAHEQNVLAIHENLPVSEKELLTQDRLGIKNCFGYAVHRLPCGGTIYYFEYHPSLDDKLPDIAEVNAWKATSREIYEKGIETSAWMWNILETKFPGCASTCFQGGEAEHAFVRTVLMLDDGNSGFCMHYDELMSNSWLHQNKRGFYILDSNGDLQEIRPETDSMVVTFGLEAEASVSARLPMGRHASQVEVDEESKGVPRIASMVQVKNRQLCGVHCGFHERQYGQQDKAYLLSL